MVLLECGGVICQLILNGRIKVLYLERHELRASIRCTRTRKRNVRLKFFRSNNSSSLTVIAGADVDVRVLVQRCLGVVVAVGVVVSVDHGRGAGVHRIDGPRLEVGRGDVVSA